MNKENRTLMDIHIDEIGTSEILERLLHNAIGVLVVVATDIELEAALLCMSPLPIYEHLAKNYHYDQTYYLGVIGSYPVALVKATMMGSLKRDASQSTVSEALQYWKPQIVIMEGIAFGRDKEKQNIGDILISETLSQYETAKQRPDGETISRGHSVPASPILLNRFAQESQWLNKAINKRLTIRKCELLSGEKLIDDLVVRDELFARFPNAQGGEMEGNGVYAACDKQKVDWIICKAICDWADGNKNDEWQALAANNAAQYVAHVLSNKTIFDSIGVFGVDSPELYKYFRHEKPTYHDLRGRDIVRIIYPRHVIRKPLTVSMPREKIYYQYVQVAITDHIRLGYVFFAKNISQEKAIKHFLSNYDGGCNSLIVCSPRIKSAFSGKDDYRLGSLEGKFLDQSGLTRNTKLQFSYVEDLVWEHCLGQDSSSLEHDIPEEKYFIDQEISPANHEHHEFKKKSLHYFRDVLSTDSRDKPLIAVIGGAGVGKTTLCDQLIKLVELQQKKKAIYISSSDIVAGAVGTDILTVTDLYRASYEESTEEHDSLLDPTNLEINISCGNVVVIIDGLDEIEAKLKDRFNFDSFIQGAVALNESYNNCAIVVTSRDYYKSKYEGNGFIELLSLYGFDDDLAFQYFRKRLPSHIVSKAKKQLEALNISSRGHYPPVILSLICDVLESEEKLGNKKTTDHIASPKYLDTNVTMDFLLVRLLDREITRQSLKMSVEDVLDVLVEVASCESGSMSKIELDNYLEIYDKDQIGGPYVSFYVNPLLKTSPDDKFVEFRYDAVLLLLRSRYFIYCICNENPNIDYIKFAGREFYDGKGDLLYDIHLSQKLAEAAIFDGTKRVLKKLITDHEDCILGKNRKALEQSKKYISAVLYYYFGSAPNATRGERSTKLLELYDKDVRYMFIYGNFYPLDFSVLKVKDSGFYDYGNFEKSNFPLNQKVFFNTEFKGIAPTASVGAEISIFDGSCELNKRLKYAISKEEESKGEIVSLIKNDFVLVLSVLYRNRSFVKKSENIFKTKKSKIYPKLSMEDYLSYFMECQVFGREHSHSNGSKYHYYVEDGFKDDVRYLLTNSNFRPDLENVFDKFLKKEFGIAV